MMNSSNDGIENDRERLTALFDCLASDERRHLLGLIHSRVPSSVSQERLATGLAAKNHSKSPDRVTEEEHHHALHTIHHVHLPKLDAARLIKQDADSDSISLSDHPAYRDTALLDVIHDEVSVGTESLDALFRGLADARRRTTLDVLSHQYQPIQLRTLARDVAHHESPRQDVETEDVERTLRGLQHVHLPHLREAGLVEYDTEEETVAYEGHPVLRVRWLHSELGPDFRGTLTDSPTDAAIWRSVHQ